MAENKFEITGKVYAFGELKTYGNNDDYKKQDVFIELTNEYNDKVYTDIVKFIAFNKAIDSFNVLSVGDTVEITFRLSGKMWSPKDEEKTINFTENKIIYITRLSGAPQTDATKVSTAETNEATDAVDFNDLPF